MPTHLLLGHGSVRCGCRHSRLSSQGIGPEAPVGGECMLGDGVLACRWVAPGASSRAIGPRREDRSHRESRTITHHTVVHERALVLSVSHVASFPDVDLRQSRPTRRRRVQIGMRESTPPLSRNVKRVAKQSATSWPERRMKALAMSRSPISKRAHGFY